MSAAINHTAAMRKLEALFNNIDVVPTAPYNEFCEIEKKRDKKCDVHGDKSIRRGSLGNNTSNATSSIGNIFIPNKDTRSYGIGPRRESMPALNIQNNFNTR